MAILSDAALLIPGYANIEIYIKSKDMGFSTYNEIYNDTVTPVMDNESEAWSNRKH